MDIFFMGASSYCNHPELYAVRKGISSPSFEFQDWQAVEKGFRCPRIVGNRALKSLLMDLERHFPSPKGYFGSFFNSLLGCA
jgi:hypothetical protein